MKAAVALLCLALCLCIHQAAGAKYKYTTEAPAAAEYDDQEEEAEATDDTDEMAKYITPQCMKTLQKHKDDFNDIKGHPEKGEKLIQELVKGGCKPLLDYMMKKQKRESQG